MAGLVPGCGAGEAPPESAPPAPPAQAARLTSAPTPTQIILEPEADTFVRDSSPNGDFGTNPNLNVDARYAETYLRFNLSSIPAGAHIASVRLEALAHYGFAYGGDGSVYAHLVPNDTWSETGITWNNKPAASSDDLGSWQLWNRTGQYTTQVGVNSSLKFVEPVQQALGSDGMISFRLDSPGSRSVYDSREYSNTTARWPRLIVYYSLPTATP